MKIAKVEFQNSARPESNEARVMQMGGFTLYNMVTMGGYHGAHGWWLWVVAMVTFYMHGDVAV